MRRGIDSGVTVEDPSGLWTSVALFALVGLVDWGVVWAYTVVTGALRSPEVQAAYLASSVFALLMLAPDQARYLGQQGRRIARDHTPDRFADEILQAYHDAHHRWSDGRGT